MGSIFMRQKIAMSLIFAIQSSLLLGVVYAVLTNEKTLPQNMQSIAVALSAQSLLVQIFFVGEIVNKIIEFAVGFAAVFTVFLVSSVSVKERIEVAYVYFSKLLFLVSLTVVFRLKLSAVLIFSMPYLPVLPVVLVAIRGLSFGLVLTRFNGSSKNVKISIKTISILFQNTFHSILMLFSMYRWAFRLNLKMLLSRRKLAENCVLCGTRIIERDRYECAFCLAIFRDYLAFLRIRF
jgi:hypothetical protein